MNTIIEKLNELAEAQARKTLLSIDKNEAIEKVLTQEIRDQLTEIDIEFDNPEKGINIQISELTNDIKALTVLHGGAVAGKYLKSIYVKGRKSWDTKGLMGWAVENPDVLLFYKQGKPHARIGEVK